MNIEEELNIKISDAINKWHFEKACNYYEELLQYSLKYISEYIKLLADFGKLDTLFSLFDKYGFNFIKELAQDPQQKHPGVISYCLKFMEDKYIPSRYSEAKSDKNSTILALTSKRDKHQLLNYLEVNSDSILNNHTDAEDNMILNFAINNLLSAKLMSSELGIKITPVFTENKNINNLRKRFVLSSILNFFYSNEEQEFFKLKSQWYNHLQKIAARLTTFINDEGAKDAYLKFSNAIIKSNNTTMKFNNEKEYRVAVCISGMFRGNAAAIQTIQDNIITPLNADVFIHSWDSWQTWPGIGGSGPQNWIARLLVPDIAECCPDGLRSFLEFKKYFPRSAEIIETPVSQPFSQEFLTSFIQPTSFCLDNEDDFIASLGSHAAAFSARGAYNQAKMFYGIYEATQLMVEYENQHSFKYDYVIRIRPDCAIVGEVSKNFLKKLGYNALSTSMTSIVGPSDVFSISRRDVHVRMADLWKASLNAKSLSPFEHFPKYDAHALLFLWMIKNHITPITPPVKTQLTLVTSTSIATPNLHDALIYDLQHTAKKFDQDENSNKFIDFLLGKNK